MVGRLLEAGRKPTTVRLRIILALIFLIMLLTIILGGALLEGEAMLPYSVTAALALATTAALAFLVSRADIRN